MGVRRGSGSLALIGGGEWGPGTDDFDAELLGRSGAKEVLVLPTAAAFEHPERVGDRAEAHFNHLGATTRTLAVLHRSEAEDHALAKVVRASKFVYLADGSPLHLRSVLKESALFGALVAAYDDGAVIAASGAGATLLCDPMVDPRGGAYTVGLGVVEGIAVFPYHGTAADHLRARSIDLLPRTAVLAGIDEATALVVGPDGWSVAGAGTVTIYAGTDVTTYAAGDLPEGLPA
jgi:cyanophycinase